MLVRNRRVGLIGERVRQRNERRLEGLRIDAAERAAPGIGDPDDAALAVDAHAARSLRLWERRADLPRPIGGVELVIGRRRARHLVFYGRQLQFCGLAGREIGLDDGVESHLRPVAVAVLVADDAVGLADGAVWSAWVH